MKKEQKQYTQILITGILIVLILNTVRSIIQLNKSVKKVEDIKQRINMVESENIELKKKIQYALTDQFLEKEAVEKLKLVKPGYRILIINDKYNSEDNENDEGKVNEPNYKLWLKAFGLQ